MNFPPAIQTSWTPEKIQKFYRANGKEISITAAEGILQFMIKLAQSTQLLSDEKSIPLHQGKHRRAS
jgi:hypothetical protein